MDPQELHNMLGALVSNCQELGKVCETWGEQHMLTIAMEENAELIQAISKIKRNGLDPINASHLDEETADVLICICELFVMGYLDVHEIVEEKEAEYKKLEEEYWFLKEEYEELEEVCQDLKKENNTLKRKCKSYEDGSKTLWSIYNKDLEKMKDLQMFNNKLVKSNKTANRDFFILAAAYVATLVLMIYLFIR